MSRLKFPYHIQFSEFPQFVAAWVNTPPAHLKGWETVAENNRVSTAALVWSIWQTINFQINDPTIINKFYVEWRWHYIKLIWPYGTDNIPVAPFGLAKMGWTIPGMTEQNAIL